MSTNSYREHLLKSGATFLGRWNGCEARIWEYAAGHSAFTIRITSKNKPGNLHLSCLGPDYIKGPMAWSNCALRLLADVPLGDGRNGYALIDESAGFEMRCEKVEIAESCKPL